MTPAATLSPVSGSPAQLWLEVRRWLAQDDQPTLTIRTSGSSGSPKLVTLSRRALVASATATHTRLGGSGQWLLALPPQHVAGLQVLVRSALAGIRPVLLDDHHDLRAATAALSASSRYISVVPTQLHRWLADPVGSGALASYDAVLVGGGATNQRLLQRARDAGVSVVATYGMTETCGGCVYDGVPLDGVGIAIGATGRIRVSGPVLFDGYVDRADLTAEVLQDGWFVTADLGRLDVDGRLEVLGRVDDVIVSGGVNVPLEPVRRRLLARQELTDVVVLGVPDPEWGQRVVAVATLAAGATAPDLGELRDFVAAEHPRAWAPRELVVRERLPMLESGKVDRLSLVAELAGGS